MIKAVGRIFEISDLNPIRGNAQNAEVPSRPRTLTLKVRGTPRSKNAENADTKVRKLRLTGFSVTGFR